MIAPSKTFTTTLKREGNLCAIEVPFDPEPVFGKVRAPVKVTLNGYTYRSTIASMGGCWLLPLAKVNREAAGLECNETLPVNLTLDTEERVVEVPADLEKALRKAGAWQQFREMSYSHQREWVMAVEEAKKPETRTRRIENAVTEVGMRPVKKKSSVKKPAAKKPAAKPAAKKKAR